MCSSRLSHLPTRGRDHAALWTAVVLPVLFLLFLPITALGQTISATITGTVTDPSGAVVPNATVVAINTATQTQFKAVTNSAGIYIIQMPEGTYVVTFKAAGFKDFTATDVILVSRAVRRVDAKLEVGSVATTVQVKAGAQVINTETTGLSDTKSAVRLDTLPESHRAVWSLLTVTPGVVDSGINSTVRFAGSTENQANWSIDGITFSNPTDGTQMGPAAGYLDYIKEMRVDYTNNSADIGALGQVTLITKSGTNQFHGTVFDYYGSHDLRARGPFASTSPLGVAHQPGFNIGGPVILPHLYNGKDKTFFFFDWETGKGSQTNSYSQGTVPTDAMLKNGDFSSLCTSGFTNGVCNMSNPDDIQITNPFTGLPYSGNIIPSGSNPGDINPVAQAIGERFYPSPNTGDLTTVHANNWQMPLVMPFTAYTFYTFRIDQHLNSKNWGFFRFLHNGFSGNWLPNTLPAEKFIYYSRINHGISAAFTHIFGPTLMSETRWGYTTDWTRYGVQFNGNAFVNQYGLTGLASGIPDSLKGFPEMLVSGLTAPVDSWANGGPNSPSPTNISEDFQEYLTWLHGRHTVKMGYELDRGSQDQLTSSNSLFGYNQFTGNYTGYSMADFLIGTPYYMQNAQPPIEFRAHRWTHALFITDAFKVNHRLTVNYGLRYELPLNWQEDHNRMAVFDVSNGKIVVPNAGLSEVSPLFPSSYVGVVGAKAAGIPQALFHTNKLDFAPRLGIAYRPWGENTVLRAAFGIYYNLYPEQPQMGAVSPFVEQQSGVTNTPVPSVILPQVMVSDTSGLAGPSSVALPGAYNPNIRMPYTMQYNFTIEHQQWGTGFRASYIGSGFRQGWYTYDFNAPPPNTTPYVDKLALKAFPNYPSIGYTTNGADASYNSLNLEATHPTGKGLTLQSSFVWARDTYNFDPYYDGTLEDPFNRKRDWAVSPDIPTVRFDVNAVYNLPFGRQRQWFTHMSKPANDVFGSWQLSLTYNFYSGMFLTPYWCGNDPTGTSYTNAGPAYVCIRPNQIANANLPSSQRSINNWFNVGAFTPPTAGQFGTSAKGVIKGPHSNNWNAGLYKDIPLLGENRLNLRLEMIVTNLFNHANYNNPDTTITDTTTVGTINSVGGLQGGADDIGPRQVRFGIRLQW